MTSPQTGQKRSRGFVWLMAALGFFLALGVLLLVLGLAGVYIPDPFDYII